MGEVFRARDTKLNRDVAIKVLPAAFAEDRERVARFRREAQLVASLNHPNIAAIYGLEEANGMVALALELVDGEDLQARLARGPIPLDEAIAIARQIAEGLEAAHERGIVHRDLKPANVKLTKDGAVKILDFGLAKAYEGEPGSHDSGLSQSPTMSRHMTEAGMILGTAAYMSPEQARGRAVDKRADIWSFGVVLYEMLTGRRLFAGETVSDTLAAVLRQDVDLSALPQDTPVSVRRVLERSLERDPKTRLRDIGDARHDLSRGSAADDSRAAAAPRSSSRALVAVLAVLALASSGLAAWLITTRHVSTPRTRLSIALPEGYSFLSGPAISRDGRRVAFVASNGGDRPSLWVRRLDETDPHPLPGTEEADGPFFSPDGEWIAFYARNQLWKVRADGGAPIALAGSTSHFGGAWTDAGTIVFKRSWNAGLAVVGDNGGNARPLLDTAPPNEYAFVWPRALPGGRQIVFVVWGKTFDTVLMDLKTLKRRVVARGWWQRLAWVPPDYLLGGAAEGEIVARKLTATGGEDASVTVAKGVDAGGLSGDTLFDVSENGTLVYVRGVTGGRRLVTVSRSGEITRLHVAAGDFPIAQGDFPAVRVSPDGRRAVMHSTGRLRVIDLERGTISPLAPELERPTGSQGAAVWSVDGRTVTFSSNHEGSWNIYTSPASGAGGIAPVLRRPGDPAPQTYAPDGTLLFTTTGPSTGTDIWMLPPGGEPRAWLATAAEEQLPRFSPDGRTVAFMSNVSGRFEVYVQSRDNPMDRVQVSAAGGVSPDWSPKGDRLFFRQGTVAMEAAIRTDGGISASAPVRLFDGGWTLAPSGPFEVMPDGERFLMVERPREAVPTRIEVVQGFLDELKEKLAAR
jgi:serine/threonine protein kinase/Tol biopolymer transport system component